MTGRSPPDQFDGFPGTNSVPDSLRERQGVAFNSRDHVKGICRVISSHVRVHDTLLSSDAMNSANTLVAGAGDCRARPLATRQRVCSGAKYTRGLFRTPGDAPPHLVVAYRQPSRCSLVSTRNSFFYTHHG